MPRRSFIHVPQNTSVSSTNTLRECELNSNLSANAILSQEARFRDANAKRCGSVNRSRIRGIPECLIAFNVSVDIAIPIVRGAAHLQVFRKYPILDSRRIYV